MNVAIPDGLAAGAQKVQVLLRGQPAAETFVVLQP